MDMLVKYLKLTLSMPKPQPTLEDSSVPPLFREPFIHKGYRLPYRSWKYYICSLCQCHNESFNIWSHFVAVWVFIYKIAEFHLDEINTENPLIWAYYTFAVGTLFYASLSTFAHLFQSKSELVHYLSFQIDYIGISVNALATGVSFYFFVGNELFYSHFGNIYLILIVVIAIAMCALLSYAKLKYSRPYPPARRILSVGIMGSSSFVGFFPGFYLMWESLTQDSWDHFWNMSFPHIHYTLYFILSGFFFASHIPERFMPGQLDICGQAHQIFHCVMVYTSYLQYNTLHDVFKTRRNELIKFTNPGYHNTILLLIIVLIMDVIVVYSVTSYRCKRAKEEHQKSPPHCVKHKVKTHEVQTR